MINMPTWWCGGVAIQRFICLVSEIPAKSHKGQSLHWCNGTIVGWVEDWCWSTILSLSWNVLFYQEIHINHKSITFFINQSVLFVKKKGFSVLIGSNGVYHAHTCMRNKMSVNIINTCLHHRHIQYPRKAILLLGSLMFGVIGLKFRAHHI